MSQTNPSPHRSSQSLWTSMRQIFGLSKPYRRRFYGATALALVASAISLTVPLGLKGLLDAVFENANMRLLNIITLLLLGLFVVRAGVSFISTYGLEWVGERVVADLRKELYRHLHTLGFHYFAQKRLGEITSRLTNDVSSVRTTLTDALPDSITVSFSLIGSVVMMVILNWRLSLIVFLTVPIVTILSRYFGGKIRGLARGIQDELANATAVAEDALGAIRIVKAFARETFETNRYSQAVEALFATSRQKILLSSLFWSGMGMLFMATLVTIFWFGGREVMAGRLSTGDLVAFIFYAFSISRSISQVSRLYTSINTAVGASDRIFELLDEPAEIRDQPNAVSLKKVDGTIGFQQISFAYEPGRPVLHAITFDIKSGQTVAVVGPSGAGKTTLINLIPRFFDPQEGCIFIDGRDIKTIKKQSLRQNIAMVPQDVHLFSTSIRENIRYGRLEATDAEIEQAARDANAYGFINALPNRFENTIGEKGVKLSGGQRQRLAIARAILKNPPILLLDEATSSLDSESEAQVQQALERLMQQRTTFIIAHRLSTVQNADRILVLDEGRIIQDGTHEQLIHQEGLYRHLHQLQFREEATAASSIRK